jgi:hypothetical protein
MYLPSRLTSLSSPRILPWENGEIKAAPAKVLVAIVTHGLLAERKFYLMFDFT